MRPFNNLSDEEFQQALERRQRHEQRCVRIGWALVALSIILAGAGEYLMAYPV